jgi:hypothetical protein
MRSLSLILGASVIVGCGGGNGGPPDAGVQATFSSLYSSYLNQCANCHTPTAPGRTSDTEKTLDFTTAATAYTTLTTGKASGLVGNQTACNGVAFISAPPAPSLLLAVLDQPTRSTFAVGSCDSTAVTDQTVKLGSAPSADFITALKTWLAAGAPNN